MITCAESGMFPGFFRVGLNAEFNGNILALTDVERVAAVSYIANDRFTLTLTATGQRLDFVKSQHGLYTRDFPEQHDNEDHEPRSDNEDGGPPPSTDDEGDEGPPPLVDEGSDDEDPLPRSDESDNTLHVNNLTLSERRAAFTPRQLRDADAAWEFVQNANVAENTAIEMAVSPSLSGCTITRDAIRNAFRIHGGDAAAIKGKTRRVRPTTSRAEAGVPSETGVQAMYTDVMFIRNHPFLISVVYPLDLTVCTALSSQTSKVLQTAATEQLDQLRGYGFNINVIMVDRQPSLLILSGRLGPVRVESCGAGDHIGRFENRIKTVKELFRTVSSRLTFKLARRLICDLVFYTIKRLNSQPSGASANRLAPRVRMSGVKVDFVKEYRVGFGDYVEARDPSVNSNDVEASRTDSAIALWPTGNASVSWKLLDLTTEQKVVRSQFKALPISSLVVARMNALYQADEGVSATPVNQPTVQVQQPTEPSDLHVHKVSEER